MKRPTSVTVVAIVLIVLNAIGFLSLLFSSFVSDNPDVQAAIAEQMKNSTFSYATIQVVSYVSMIITVACAVGMLKGADWSRKLYVGLGVIGLVFNGINGMNQGIAGLFGVIFGVVILGLFTFLLYRQPADNFFKGIEEDQWDDEDEFA